MKRLNETIVNKLILQADEAKTIGLTKLADTLYDAVAEMQIKSQDECFSFQELEQLVQTALWKSACGVAAYHNLNSMDIQHINQIISSSSDELISKLEDAFGAYGKMGQFEEKVPGQQKD